MSSDHENFSNEQKTKQTSKSSFENNKRNLSNIIHFPLNQVFYDNFKGARPSNEISNSFKFHPQKMSQRKTIQAIQRPLPVFNLSTNKEKTPIKSKQNEDINKKIQVFNEKGFKELEENDKKPFYESKKMNFLIKDESPWTKFCKRDLSPLCKNTLFSPNKQVANENEGFSQSK